MERLYFNSSDFTDGYALIPDGFPENKSARAWIVVEVHGAGGLKEKDRGEWLLDLLYPTPVIVLVPSFSDGYQAGNGMWAEQLLDHVSMIKKSYPVHEGLFLHGHSGGAQFVHRFAFHRPDQVIGVSAHSAGSWACDGGIGCISPDAKHIPFLISCGEEDTAYSVPDAPYTRIEWYRRFAAALKNEGFTFQGFTWPGVGHAVDHSLYKDAFLDCFRLASRGGS
jgi:pimeloyl-ACP methyl ester carboxylesterase